MVVKLDNLQAQNSIGSTAHHPRWAIAYKFKARQATSQLLHIDYQVGRTGAVTPVAKIEPVRLAGVTVSSVSLHNADFIKEKDVHIGDFVKVERAGDVIPYIASVDLTKRKDVEAVVFPTECPSCQAELIRPEGEAVWRCENVECPAQAEERIIHFVSKGAMDIDGLGDKLIDQLVEKELVASIADIYRLRANDLALLDRMAEKSALKLINAIEASKDTSLSRFIFALGIREVGETTAALLAKKLITLDDIIGADCQSLEALPDIGPVMANNIYSFFSTIKNIESINELLSLGVSFEHIDNNRAQNNDLEGKKFVITGTLPNRTRDEIKALLLERGAKVSGSVSKNTSYLIAGESAGSKLSKAEDLGIPILNEAQALALMHISV